MNVRFTTPRHPGTTEVDIDLNRTAGEVIQSLVGGGTLLPVTGRREYGLVNAMTREVILPGRSLRDAGVEGGDIVEVLQAVEGGRG